MIKVAPFTGAWIEIFSGSYLVPGGGVAPFTGAWIEICSPSYRSYDQKRRSLRGSVD